jgi:hypothetical protein
LTDKLQVEGEGNTELEYMIRMILNVVFNMIIYNQDDPSLVEDDLLNPQFLVEEYCFKNIKLSLEMSNVPIRKVLIIFYLFERFLFGEVNTTVKESKNLKYTT